MSVVSFAFMLVGSLIWHLLRIATLRPAFGNLKPSNLTVGVFSAAYFAAGMTRAELGEYAAASSFIGLALYLGALGVIFRLACPKLVYAEKQFPFAPHWVLVVALLGSSVVVDCCAIIGHYLWGVSPFGGWWLAADLCMTLGVCGRFALWAGHNPRI